MEIVDFQMEEDCVRTQHWSNGKPKFLPKKWQSLCRHPGCGFARIYARYRPSRHCSGFCSGAVVVSKSASDEDLLSSLSLVERVHR